MAVREERTAVGINRPTAVGPLKPPLEGRQQQLDGRQQESQGTQRRRPAGARSLPISCQRQFRQVRSDGLRRAALRAGARLRGPPATAAAGPGPGPERVAHAPHRVPGDNCDALLTQQLIQPTMKVLVLAELYAPTRVYVNGHFVGTLQPPATAAFTPYTLLVETRFLHLPRNPYAGPLRFPAQVLRAVLGWP